MKLEKEFLICTNFGINKSHTWVRQVLFLVLAKNSEFDQVKTQFEVNDYDVPLTNKVGRSKLRQEFENNKHVNDIRAIDLLVIKVKSLNTQSLF